MTARMPHARLRERVVLVTGSGTGIGKAIAIASAAEGAQVVCAGMDLEANRQTAREIEAGGGIATVIGCDVRVASDVESLVAGAIAHYGHVDVMCNNAGIGIHGQLHEVPEEQWRDSFRTNVDSIYYTTRALIPHFRERQSGNIVNIASTFGLLAYPAYAAYCATKGAVVALTKQMALDYGPHIRVNCICPGATEAPRVRRYIDSTPDPAATEASFAALNRALHRLARPDEVASVFVFLASDESSFITGHSLVVDGGQTIDA